MEEILESIAIVDDHNLFRKGMRILLQRNLPDVEIREFSDGAALVEAIDNHAYCPDIVLLDLEMPKMDGIEISRRLLADVNNAHLKIIILTMHDEKSLILDLIDQGVHGYVLKDADLAEVVKAIHHVQDGQYYVSQNTFDAIQPKPGMNGRFKRSFKDGKESLSEREEEILLLICQEHTNKEIADLLNLSVRTVDGHRSRLLKKTGMKNTAGLVKYALQHELYSLD